MRLYPQLLLWTYVLLPAISLLLAPTFIIALARAQQHRAKVMANALSARVKTAAAIARNHQRRYIPYNKYSNGFGQNRPFGLRSKRESNMAIPHIVPPIIKNPKTLNNFERKSHWDQQEESLGQLENMWNMNNFGSTQNGEVIRSMHKDSESEKAIEENVGDPFLYSHKDHKNDGKSDYYSGAFSGRNVFDEVLEQSEPISLIQNEHGEQFVEDRSAIPEPTFKKKKTKFGMKQEPYPQNYYNSYNPQHSYPNLYYRSAEQEGTSQITPMEADDMERATNGDSSTPDQRLANPEPTFNKLKMKLGKKQEPHPQNYNNFYYPQYSQGGSYYPYARSDELKNIPSDGLIEAKDITGAVIGDPLHNKEILGNPEPTFKKKLGKKKEPHPQNYYNSYYPQYSQGGSYYPYARSDESEETSQVEPIEAKDIIGAVFGDSSNTEERLGSPEPTLKKLTKKFGKDHEPYPYPPSYYNSYFPQYSQSSSYHYPYYREAEIEDLPQHDTMADDKTIINGEQLLQHMEPKSADPDPTFKKKKIKFGKEPQTDYGYAYNPYSRESETQRMHQNLQEHAMDDFMMGELVLPRFANPQPTFKKKKKQIEHMPSSFYYPQNQYNSYYSPNAYSNSNYNPYGRSVEAEMGQDNAIKRSIINNEKIGEDNFFEGEQKSANPELHHSHNKIETKQGGEGNFFYSSNFYERENDERTVADDNNGSNISKQEENGELPSSLNIEEHAPRNQKAIDEPKNLSGDKNINSSQTSENVRASLNNRNGQENPEEVGCELEEKIEEKIQKKLKKLLKKDKKEDENKINYSYQPMYPPNTYYGGEYKEPEYYRSALDTDRIDEPIEHDVESHKNVDEHVEVLAHKIGPDRATTTDFAENIPLLNEAINNANQQIQEVHAKSFPDMIPQTDFSENTPPPNELINNANHQIKIPGPVTNNQNIIPTHVFPQNMVNSRSSLHVGHTHSHPEEVGCELDDNLFDSKSSINSFDPTSFYQRAVDEISEESKKFAEETKKLFHPEEQPSNPVKPKLTYVDMDEISKNEYRSNEQVHNDLIFPDRNKLFTPSEEKSADPNANPTHHSRGLTHTHSHFHSHTHGHTHQKTIGNHHGAQDFHSVTPQFQIPPSHHQSQVFPHQQGFSQANAKAQTFNHGGVHHNIAHANANSFGNGFGSNTATAQSGAQAFNEGQINGFGSNSHITQSGLQTFPNGGFGQSAASAGSLIQNTGQLNTFGLNRGIAQSGAQALNGRQINDFGSGAIAQSEAQAINNGRFGHTSASAGSIIQNGPNFIPNAAQPLFNGGFAQSAAHATAQASLAGLNDGHNFENGFQNTHGLTFNNNPTQFASSSANAQIVGQPREFFVMPHVDEIPVRNLFSEMKSDTHRFSRTPQEFEDAFKGLGLASNIVDASLNKNMLLDEKAEKSDELEDTQKTIGFVTNIVDASIRAGEDNTQIDHAIKTPADSESARHLTLQGITSITDLVSKGLRSKRQVIRQENNDFYKKEHIVLGNDVKEPKMNRDNNSSNVGIPIDHLKTSLSDNTVLRNKSSDELLQISNETEETTNQNLNGNKNVDNGKEIIQASVSKNNPFEISGIKNEAVEVTILEMVDPDTLTPTPEIITNEPWASNWNYKTNKVIYVTPIIKDVSTKSEAADTFDSIKLDTTTENTLSVHHKEALHTSPRLEIPINGSLNNLVNKSPNVTDHDDIIGYALTNGYQSANSQKVSFKEISTESTNGLQNNLDMNVPRTEINNFNVTRNDSILELHISTDNSSMRENNKDSDNEINKNVSLLGNITDEQANTEIPREILMTYLMFPNGTRKNISELTSEEVQDIQFDLPKNSKEVNTPAQGHGNSTSGETILGLSLQNNKNSSAKQENNNKEFGNKEDILESAAKNNKMEANSTNTLQDDSQVHKITPSSIHDRFQKNSIQRLIANMSEGPFASIEVEMGALTDEEKEAFIKQEVDLIAEVFEEALRNINFREANLHNNTTKNIKNDTKKEVTEEASVVASPNLFQAFGRENDREEYSRQARSETSKEKIFNDLLDQHKEKVQKIKNVADEDDDLLMISFIGDSVIKDLENRRNKSNLNQTTSTNQFSQIIDNNEIINHIYSTDDSNMLKQKYLPNLSNEDNRTNISSPIKIKREIRSSRAPLTQLITDPTMKLNVEKTLQNLGSIARHTFESPRAPMYHVRNMLGNAKNSVMSAAKVPPNNFLIPSKYEIAKISRNNALDNDNVGAVNQQMLLSRSGFGNTNTEDTVKNSESDLNGVNGNSFGLEDTVQKIGGMVKESVQSGRDALIHVNDVAADAKKILHTAKSATPRFAFPRPTPMLTSRGAFTPSLGASPPVISPFDRYSLYTTHLNRKTPLLGASLPDQAPFNAPSLNRKTVLIAPRILDVQENIVGEAQEQPDNFVGMGHILDAAGFSQPNQPEVELQKIEFEPVNNMNFKPFTMPKELMLTTSNKSLVKDNLKKETNEQSSILRASQLNNMASKDSLQDDDGEPTTVTENLKDFMQRMHNEMKEIVRLQYEDRKRKRIERTKNLKTNSYNKNKKDFQGLKKSTRQTVAPIGKLNQMPAPMLGNFQSYYDLRNYDSENIGMALPQDVMNQFSQTPQHVSIYDSLKESQIEDVPIVDSRIQEISTKNNVKPLNLDISSPATNYAQKFSYPPQNAANSIKKIKNLGDTNDQEKVALFLPENLMKPFMGQPSESLIHDYMQQNGDEDVLERESSDDSMKKLKLPGITKPSNSNILIPKGQPLLPLNSLNYIPTKHYDLNKLAALSESSITRVDLHVPELQSSLSSNTPGASSSKPDIVGASLPENIANKSSSANSSKIDEQTKEFVELLSDPEINDSEVPATDSSSLDHNATDKHVMDHNLKSNKSVMVLPLPKTIILSSTEKSTIISSDFKNVNKNVDTGNDLTVKNYNIEEPETTNILDNTKQRPSFLNFHINPLKVGNVPDENDLGYVLGAINPMMFERHFNERLKIDDVSSKDTHDKFLEHGLINDGDDSSVNSAKLGHLTAENVSKILPQVKAQDLVNTNKQISSENLIQKEGNKPVKDIVKAKSNAQQVNNEIKDNEKGDPSEINDQGRTSMKVLSPYKKPFMGYMSKDKMHKFLNQYNNNLPEESYGEQEKYTQHENYNQENFVPIKNIVFPSADDDYNNYGY